MNLQMLTACTNCRSIQTPQAEMQRKIIQKRLWKPVRAAVALLLVACASKRNDASLKSSARNSFLRCRRCELPCSCASTGGCGYCRWGRAKPPPRWHRTAYRLDLRRVEPEAEGDSQALAAGFSDLCPATKPTGAVFVLHQWHADCKMQVKLTFEYDLAAQIRGVRVRCQPRLVPLFQKAGFQTAGNDTSAAIDGKIELYHAQPTA